MPSYYGAQIRHSVAIVALQHYYPLSPMGHKDNSFSISILGVHSLCCQFVPHQAKSFTRTDFVLKLNSNPPSPSPPKYQVIGEEEQLSVLLIHKCQDRDSNPHPMTSHQNFKSDAPNRSASTLKH